LSRAWVKADCASSRSVVVAVPAAVAHRHSIGFLALAMVCSATEIALAAASSWAIPRSHFRANLLFLVFQIEGAARACAWLAR